MKYLTTSLALLLYSLDGMVFFFSTEDNKPIVKVCMNFEDEEWKDVCTFVAEQFAFGLATTESGFPTGTFTFSDSREISFTGVLDKLNLQLSLLQPAYAIVRKEKQLYVVPESEINNNLIEMVNTEELNQFGEQEIVLCHFDLEPLPEETTDQLVDEIRQAIGLHHQSGFSYFRSSRSLQVRERVSTLKRISSLIDKAVKQDLIQQQLLKSYSESIDGPVKGFKLAYISPADAVDKINELICRDNKLDSANLVADLEHNRLLMYGTEAQIGTIQMIIRLLDLPNQNDKMATTRRIDIEQQQLARIIAKVIGDPFSDTPRDGKQVQLIVPLDVDRK